MTDQNHPSNPGGQQSRTDVQARQGGRAKVTVWILLFSLLLAILIGGVLLSNTDEIRETGQTSTQDGASSTTSDTPQTDSAN